MLPWCISSTSCSITSPLRCVVQSFKCPVEQSHNYTKLVSALMNFHSNVRMNMTYVCCCVILVCQNLLLREHSSLFHLSAQVHLHCNVCMNSDSHLLFFCSSLPKPSTPCAFFLPSTSLPFPLQGVGVWMGHSAERRLSSL